MRTLSLTLLALLLAIATCSCSDDADGDAGADTDADTDADAGADAGDTDTGGFDPDDLPALSFDAYHTYEEVIAYLQGVAEVAPEIATYESIGQSVEGRELGCLILDATGADDPPAFFLNGAHHGDEWPSAEAAIGFVDAALRDLDDPAVADALGYFAVYVVPIVNPDGFVLGARVNANAVDLNRDYAGPTIPAEEAFTQPETQAMRALIDARGFVGAAALHSGDFSVLWPWCYAGDPTADDASFTATGAAVAAAMGYDKYLQSYDDYPTEGELIDYAYEASGSLAFTFEVTDPKRPEPDALPGIVDTVAAGVLALLQAERAIDEGAKLAPAPPSAGVGHVLRLAADGGKLE